MLRPSIYEKSIHRFWNDPYISKQMLNAHLDPLTDAASRRPEIIKKSVDWLTSFLELDSSKYLCDLGCGPGLYCEKFAELGVQVLGVDYSENSLLYAQNSAQNKKLKIDYRLQNYLELNEQHCFDVVVLIYDDFPALTESERDNLLPRIRASLKRGGKFVFDVRTLKHFLNLKEVSFETSWPQGGFWQQDPYLELKEIILYPEMHTDLTRYQIFSKNEHRVYHIWNRSYSIESISTLLTKHQFKIIGCWSDLAGAPLNNDALEMGIVAQVIT